MSQCLFIEQPVKRENTFCRTPRIPPNLPPVIIDEADSGPDSFVAALQLGYRGVSSKQCKGIYRSLINHARVHIHGPSFLITAEDLTTQAGINVQQMQNEIFAGVSPTAAVATIRASRPPTAQTIADLRQLESVLRVEIAERACSELGRLRSLETRLRRCAKRRLLQVG